LPITLQSSEKACVIQLEDDIDVTCAAEFKQLLMEAFTARKDIQVNLDRAGDLDVTAMQLLWAAAREARKAGTSFSMSPVPERVRAQVREAGLNDFPGLAVPNANSATSTAANSGNLDDRQI